MEELTRERAHDLCVELWNDIAENSYFTKSQSKILDGHNPTHGCFACEFYATKDVDDAGFIRREFDCGKDNECPLRRGISYGCEYDGSPYHDWDTDETKESAIAIADLFID